MAEKPVIETEEISREETPEDTQVELNSKVLEGEDKGASNIVETISKDNSNTVQTDSKQVQTSFKQPEMSSKQMLNTPQTPVNATTEGKEEKELSSTTDVESLDFLKGLEDAIAKADEAEKKAEEGEEISIDDPLETIVKEVPKTAQEEKTTAEVEPKAEEKKKDKPKQEDSEQKEENKVNAVASVGDFIGVYGKEVMDLGVEIRADYLASKFGREPRYFKNKKGDDLANRMMVDAIKVLTSGEKMQASSPWTVLLMAVIFWLLPTVIKAGGEYKRQKMREARKRSRASKKYPKQGAKKTRVVPIEQHVEQEPEEELGEFVSLREIEVNRTNFKIFASTGAYCYDDEGTYRGVEVANCFPSPELKPMIAAKKSNKEIKQFLENWNQSGVTQIQ